MFSPRTLSVSSLLAVSRMMGTLHVSRSLAVAEMPSISGIMMSMRMRWMSCFFTTSRASRPVYASKRVYPSEER